jgi:hypothetical protein
VLTSALPKTRSGKIMRRVLRKLIAREYESIGDTSTLADPSVVEELKAKVDKLLGPRAPVEVEARLLGVAENSVQEPGSDAHVR